MKAICVWLTVVALSIVLSPVVSAQQQTFDQFYPAWVAGTIPLAPQIPQLDPIPPLVITPTLTVTWTALGARDYDVAFGTTTPPPIVTTPATRPTVGAWTSPALVPGATYFVQVYARNGLTSPSVVLTFTTPAAPPPTLAIACPPNLTVPSPAGQPVPAVYPLATTTGGLPPIIVTATPVSGSLFPVGVSTVTMRATSSDGQNATCPVLVTVTAPIGLPAPWLTSDIGNPALAGSATATSTAFAVSGAGIDIWNLADQFRYVYQPLVGNGTIVARVASVQAADVWTKAGVMIREGLLADAPHVSIFVTAGSGVSLQTRALRGGGSASSTTAGAAPRWVRLTRTGTSIVGASSIDGVTWTTLGTRTLTATSQVYVGLAVTSHNPAVVATASITDVLVTQAAPPPPTGLIALAWDANPPSDNVNTYFVACGLISGGPYTVLMNVGLSTAVSVTGLTLGTPYFCAVQAFNGVSSPFSNEVSGLPR